MQPATPAKLPESVFLTGGSGFIGPHIMRQLLDGGVAELYVLSRSAAAIHSNVSNDERVRWIRGDLRRPADFMAYLERSAAVVHLAAATGAAGKRKLDDINVFATRDLLRSCVAAGVQDFLFMSSIAVKSKDLENYPYAQSKLEAEQLVINSGLQSKIVRPTIVLGRNAPNWIALRRLAGAPLIPLIGGGNAHIQPVDVWDVARAVELVLSGEHKTDSVVELGGPEVLTFADFLRRIRNAEGEIGFPAVKVPTAPVRALLRIAQLVLGQKSPISSGQIAPFIEDGVATSNPIFNLLRPQMLSIEDLLARIVHEN